MEILVFYVNVDAMLMGEPAEIKLLVEDLEYELALI